MRIISDNPKHEPQERWLDEIEIVGKIVNGTQIILGDFRMTDEKAPPQQSAGKRPVERQGAVDGDLRKVNSITREPVTRAERVAYWSLGVTAGLVVATGVLAYATWDMAGSTRQLADLVKQQAVATQDALSIGKKQVVDTQDALSIGRQQAVETQDALSISRQQALAMTRQADALASQQRPDVRFQVSGDPHINKQSNNIAWDVTYQNIGSRPAAKLQVKSYMSIGGGNFTRQGSDEESNLKSHASAAMTLFSDKIYTDKQLSLLLQNDLDIKLLIEASYDVGSDGERFKTAFCWGRMSNGSLKNLDAKVCQEEKQR